MKRNLLLVIRKMVKSNKNYKIKFLFEPNVNKNYNPINLENLCNRGSDIF